MIASWHGMRPGWQVSGTETMRWCKRSGPFAPWWTSTGSTVSPKCPLRRWTVRGNQRTDVPPAHPPLAPPSASPPTPFLLLLLGGSRIILTLFDLWIKLILILFNAKNYPRASCGRMARAVPLRNVCIFSSNLRKVMNLCNKLRYISIWADKQKCSRYLWSGSLVNDDGRFSRAVS